MQAQGALIIEWPERMEQLIPEERLWVSLDHAGEKEREMKFNAAGDRYAELLDMLRTMGGG
jgi:tRNA A37 threonylcarbamoyladenosine biosynthesis protein TsaE